MPTFCGAPVGKKLNCCIVCRVNKVCEKLPETASLKDLLKAVGDKKELMACQYNSWELDEYIENVDKLIHRGQCGGRFR